MARGMENERKNERMKGRCKNKLILLEKRLYQRIHRFKQRINQYFQITFLNFKTNPSSSNASFVTTGSATGPQKIQTTQYHEPYR